MAVCPRLRAKRNQLLTCLPLRADSWAVPECPMSNAQCRMSKEARSGDAWACGPCAVLQLQSVAVPPLATDPTNRRCQAARTAMSGSSHASRGCSFCVHSSPPWSLDIRRWTFDILQRQTFPSGAAPAPRPAGSRMPRSQRMAVCPRLQAKRNQLLTCLPLRADSWAVPECPMSNAQCRMSKEARSGDAWACGPCAVLQLQSVAVPPLATDPTNRRCQAARTAMSGSSHASRGCSFCVHSSLPWSLDIRRWTFDILQRQTFPSGAAPAPRPAGSRMPRSQRMAVCPSPAGQTKSAPHLLASSC